MSDMVTIKCIEGSLKRQTWTFHCVDTAIIGRTAKEDRTIVNKINVTGNDRISRFNTFFKIDPPYVIVRDMGSLNGTYVNGRIIGKREDGMSAEEGRRGSYREVRLKDSDVIGMGTAGYREQFIVNIEEEKPDGKMQISDIVNEAIKKQEEAEREYAIAVVGLRILKTLGHGGVASVQLVEDVKTHKQMALKLMHPAAQTNPQKRFWFMREASVMMQLKHPNIVTTHQLLFSGRDFHILMEYCKGGSLEDLCANNGGKLGLLLATEIICQILDALDYAHNAQIIMESKGGKRQVRGVVHRDIKPQNILLAEDGTVKLSDFGLAKAFELAGQTAGGLPTLSGQYCGSALFCSRKQLNHYRDAKPEVDVWSAAATYYYLLTGRYVRDQNGCKDIYEYIYKNDVQPILTRNPGIPVRLAKVIDKVLKEEEKESSTYTTAREFKNQILEALK